MGDWVVVDRIVEGIGVLVTDSGETIDIPIDALPRGVKEQDCIYLAGGKFILDPAETQRRQDKNRDLFRSLLEQ